ncbi:MAG TPA: alpha/beta hydrolase [Caulobacteraceae bacterium]|nr:alpha/beta hydrolase [Caulobacteraceae bacterium]
MPADAIRATAPFEVHGESSEIPPMVQPREVETEGAMIRYRLWEQAGPDAPGLLFAHGFRAHSRWWDHIAPAFAADYRVAALDFSGFGDSDWRDTYSAHSFARELLAVADHARLTPVTIVAHSFGGTPAAHAAYMAPEKVRRVVIIDSRMLIAPVPEPEAFELSKVGRVNHVFDDLETLVRRFRLLPPVEAVAPGLLDYIARHSVRPVEGGWAWKFDARLDPQLVGDPQRLAPPDIRPPLDFIYGSRSDVAPPALARTIAAYYGREPMFIADANHHLPLECPEALIDALRGLLIAAA